MVQRFAPTKAKAVATLKDALARWEEDSVKDAPITRRSTVGEGAAYWLGVIARPESRLAAQSLRSYRGSVTNHITGSSIEHLTLAEANSVHRLERFLQGVAAERGTGAAATAHRVLSGIYKEALRLGVLDMVAITNTRKPKSSKPKAVRQHLEHERSLTPDELRQLLGHVRGSELAVRHDLVDLVHLLAGTGARASEARNLEWSDVDLEAGTVRLRGTKTVRSDRVVALPAWLLERLRARLESGLAPGSAVFPSPGKLGYPRPDPDVPRDQSNTDHRLRELYDEAGFPWVSGHTFRRTVATAITAAGLPIVVAADQLGHSDVTTTLNRYRGRHVSDLSSVAALLRDGREA